MSEGNTVPVIIRTPVYLNDPEFFCNKSWTMSFNFNTKSWVSFHSYIPNFYIAENNFFYSGLNGCCDAIDADVSFTALVGELDKTPPTTTSTTTSEKPVTTSTTTTTMKPLDCTLEGEVIITSCELEGEAIITIPPVPTTTICQRYNTPNTNNFILGYDESCGSEVVTTGSYTDACTAVNYLFNLEDWSYVNFNIMSVSYYSLEIGQTIYLDANSLDCTVVPDGFYYTDESINSQTIYQVENGVLVGIFNCNTTTTTTTFIPNTQCYTVNVYGNVILIWTDGTNTVHYDEYTDTTVTLCAQLDTISYETEGDGYIFIEACGVPCSDVIDCPTTTTTTTI